MLSYLFGPKVGKMVALSSAALLAGCCMYGSTGGTEQWRWVQGQQGVAAASPDEAERQCREACDCLGAELDLCMQSRGYQKERYHVPRRCRSASLF